MIRRFSLLLLMVLAAASCATSPPPHQLVSGSWVLTEINGTPTIEGYSPRIMFDPDRGIVGGTASCNSYGGSFRQDETGLEIIDELESTLVGCRIPGISMERYFSEANRFFQILHSGVLRARITEAGELVLRDERRRTLRFDPVPTSN